ncbi:uncharacterized protein BJ212DRAFT_1298355 [Suillus subaureus]|uniref:Uncharacterized protein n=1 Tax=Suillus subaureus TaxID=48587 RepID=A0A9P7EDV4_9AGAM|nr:uncharacterized protein BJ212DRAFT_1298355 [Suillus subaureus]KAG1819086.1 hypothetical protein BJ212DRAFT_1298355 [Suillus subaureus]
MEKTANLNTPDSNAILTSAASNSHWQSASGSSQTAQDLEASFVWAPPLSTEPSNADDLLAGPESILPDDIAAEFAALEELKRTEKVQNINEVEVLGENDFDFDELDRVEQGIIPQAILEEVEVVGYNGEDDRWDLSPTFPPSRMTIL